MTKAASWSLPRSAARSQSSRIERTARPPRSASSASSPRNVMSGCSATSLVPKTARRGDRHPSAGRRAVSKLIKLHNLCATDLRPTFGILTEKFQAAWIFTIGSKNTIHG